MQGCSHSQIAVWHAWIASDTPSMRLGLQIRGTLAWADWTRMGANVSDSDCVRCFCAVKRMPVAEILCQRKSSSSRAQTMLVQL